MSNDARRWIRVGSHGWQCGEYRIGLSMVDGCSLYTVWFVDAEIGAKDEFDDARAVAREHARKQGAQK